MNSEIERPSDVDLESVSPEELEQGLSFWLHVPVPVRKEIVALLDGGWRFVRGRGAICLADPDEEEIWISFAYLTFERTISGELAWRIDEEAGRGWWTHEQWTDNPNWRSLPAPSPRSAPTPTGVSGPGSERRSSPWQSDPPEPE